QAGDPLAVGVLLMLLLGLRASEVLQRPVRDVDDGGRVLWITRGKTTNSRRRLQVPEVLQPLLRRLVHGKQPVAWLLGATRTGRPKHLEYLWAKVHALCTVAGVPVVCSHSLRGLHSTLAIEAGATANLVAAALGHGSFAVTARHYADPDALLGAQARRVNHALLPTDDVPPVSADPPAAPTISKEQLSEALRELLTHDQLQQLERKLFCS
ncbi:MAG TPA: tyrosine-type recombinase/integrase, partial [Pseudomonadota bacterium]|nr:tyrosine-type recombinase/integrase [Pseudomonadota bacterium]